MEITLLNVSPNYEAVVNEIKEAYPEATIDAKSYITYVSINSELVHCYFSRFYSPETHDYFHALRFYDPTHQRKELFIKLENLDTIFGIR